MRKETISGKSVVVTGGAGFIGSHLADRLLLQGAARLAVVDNFSLGKRRNIRGFGKNSTVRIYNQDASDYSKMERILLMVRPAVVFNLAVIPLPKSLELPKETVEENILITTTMCELLRKRRFKTLIHCSSSEAYGSALYVPMDESHPEKPLTPYAASKIACDHVAISYYKTFGLDIAIARPFNTYGPRQNEKSYAGVIPLTIRRLQEGQAPVIYGDGRQTRDYTFVDDMVDGIMGVYRSPSTRGQIVNIASGREITIKRLIEKITKLMHYYGEIVYKPARPGDVLRHRGDTSLARRLFGYAPKTSFDKGLGRTIEWYEKELKSRS